MLLKWIGISFFQEIKERRLFANVSKAKFFALKSGKT
jgi:hypothetical protein